MKDAQWTCQGDLVPVDVTAISSSQFVIYRYGVFLIKLLHTAIDTPEVTLLLASNLPPNNYRWVTVWSRGIFTNQKNVTLR